MMREFLDYQLWDLPACDRESIVDDQPTQMKAEA